MRYKIMRRLGGGAHQEFSQTNWLTDACWIVRALSYTSPVVFDIIDTVTKTVYKHNFALSADIPGDNAPVEEKA
jgi:hypothetical protein